MHKILLLIDNLGSGGAQRQIVTLALLLKKRGEDVSLLTYSNENFFLKEIKKNNIPIHYCNAKNYLNRIFKVRRYIRKGNYQAVISFMDVPNFLNNFAAIGGKRWKVITSERSSKENYLLSKKGKLFAWFQRFSDAIVCNSHNAKTMWEKYYPQYIDKLKVIYNPVILPKINSEYTPRKNGKTNIVIAASYQHIKNPIGVINALLLLNTREKEQIKINWYGQIEVTTANTKAYDEAVELIEKHKLHKIICLHGPTKNILNLMKKADFVGLFSELEGLPNAVCEGMMIGKPIIMSRVSDYSVLVDEANGYLCDWNKPETIKKALVAARKITNEELAAKGLCSKKKAEKLFEPNTLLNSWLDIIHKSLLSEIYDKKNKK